MPFWLISGGEWDRLAIQFERSASDPRGGNANSVLSASLAALALVRAGREEDARLLLNDLMALLEQMSPAMHYRNGAVAFAATAGWELRASEFAGVFHRLALDLLAAGVGDYPGTSLELSVARMASLLGDGEEAAAYFARARTALEASGRRPLRAIADYDEALALERSGSAAFDQIDALLRRAAAAFEVLGLGGWQQRASGTRALLQLAQGERLASSRLSAGRLLLLLLDLLDTCEPALAARQMPAEWKRARALRERLRRTAGQSTAAQQAGLTQRELEILSQLAAGRSSREIAAELTLSERTVGRHISNIYSKIGVHRRVGAGAYALRHGITNPHTNAAP